MTNRFNMVHSEVCNKKGRKLDRARAAIQSFGWHCAQFEVSWKKITVTLKLCNFDSLMVKPKSV